MYAIRLETGHCMSSSFCTAVFSPSIRREQETVDKENRPRTLAVEGRHDPCICPRIVPVVEAMTALVLADLALRQLR